MQYSSNSSQIDKRLRLKKIYSDLHLSHYSPFRGAQNFPMHGNSVVVSLSWKHTSKARKSYRRHKLPKRVYAKSYNGIIFHDLYLERRP